MTDAQSSAERGRGDGAGTDHTLGGVGDRLGDGVGLLDGHGGKLVVAVEPQACTRASVKRDLFSGKRDLFISRRTTGLRPEKLSN